MADAHASPSHPPSQTREIASINEVCEMMNVSRRTVYNWMIAGRIEWILTPSGGRRIFVDTLYKQPTVPAATVAADASMTTSKSITT